MEYEEIKPYIGKKTIVKDNYGHTFRGVITNTVSEFDTASGKEEIEMFNEKLDVYFGLPYEEISKILIIE